MLRLPPSRCSTRHGHTRPRRRISGGSIVALANALGCRPRELPGVEVASSPTSPPVMRARPRRGRAQDAKQGTPSPTCWARTTTLRSLSGSGPIAHPGVTSPIIGPRTMEQLDDLLAGAGVPLGDEALAPGPAPR